MIKKTFNYKNFLGLEVKKDWYFNISKTEYLEKEMTTPGGYAAMLQEAMDAKDNVVLFKCFKEFILGSVGKISDDGNDFVKSQAITDEFAQSPAYEMLVMEFFGENGADKGAEFINGIFPADVAEKAKELKAQRDAT